MILASAHPHMREEGLRRFRPRVSAQLDVAQLGAAQLGAAQLDIGGSRGVVRLGGLGCTAPRYSREVVPRWRREMERARRVSELTP